MKKRNRICIILTLCATSMFAQSSESLMEWLMFFLEREQNTCSHISRMNSLFFVEFMDEGKLDSAKNLLDRWETRCGSSEPVLRARLLLALKTGHFSDSLFPKNPLDMIFNYQQRMRIIQSWNFQEYDSRRAYFGFVPPGEDFDNFTRRLAAELRNLYPKGSLEYILAEFYSDNIDAFFVKIQAPEFRETVLVKDYNTIVQRYRNMSEFHLALIAGVWIPTGRLSQLGEHPDVGFQMGLKKNKMNYDMTMSFKFLNSPTYFYAKRNVHSPPELTNRFFGMYFGFDVGWDVLAHNRHEMQLLGGFGLDMIEFLKPTYRDGSNGAVAVTPNLNFGLAYRRYFSNSSYIGVRAKYNIVDYTLTNAINFNGHPITVQFTIGSLIDFFNEKKGGLKALKQPIR